jgi:threonine dehydratase
MWSLPDHCYNVVMRQPRFEDVLRAKKTMAPHLGRTPLVAYPMLDALVGTRVWVKREDTQPTSAFKVRGGINFMASLTADAAKTNGIISCSTGNHGQSMAYAAARFGVRCTIGVPVTANPAKIAGMKAYGAEVLLHGKDFDEARAHVEQIAEAEGLRYVHAANEPLLIAGVATHTLEVFEDLPDVDVVIVPLGGGSGAAGAAIVAKTLRPETRVVAVQSAQAPAAAESWKAKAIRSVPIRSHAEGLQTGVGFELTQRILWELLDECVLVDDREIDEAVLAYLEAAHVLAEHAGAAPLAAALRIKDRLAGKKVALILSGANITPAQLEATRARVTGAP